MSRKMVVRVEDLVRWWCPQPADWSSSVKAVVAAVATATPCGTNGLHKPLQSSDANGSSNNAANKSSEPLNIKKEESKKQQNTTYLYGTSFLIYFLLL